MIAVCPFCQKRISASEPLFGTVGKCPGCGAKIRLPGAEGGEAQGLEAPASAPAPAAAREPEIEMSAAPPPHVENVASPAFSPIPRAVPMGRAPVMQRRGKMGAGLGVGGAVIVLIVIRVIIAGVGGLNSSSQASAVKFNDAIANADKPVLQSCEGFARELGTWLEGGAANVEALHGAQENAKRASQSYTQKINALSPPSSDEARVFMASARSLSTAYQEITNQLFTEVTTIVADGKSGAEPGMERVRKLLEQCDSKLGVAQRNLGDAQAAFAKRHNIQLVAPK